MPPGSGYWKWGRFSKRRGDTLGAVNVVFFRRQRVFATAQRMASAMVHDHLMAWVTPTPGVPVFDPALFATSTDTLILLTQDKAGPLAAYVSSLVTQVANAAVAEAGRHRSERLPVPMVMDLDGMRRQSEAERLKAEGLAAQREAIALQRRAMQASIEASEAQTEAWNAKREASIREAEAAEASRAAWEEARAAAEMDRRLNEARWVAWTERMAAEAAEAAGKS